MAKYVFLYSGGKMPESEAEMAAVVNDWEAWYSQLGPALVDPGDPFTPQARNVASDGTVSEGPIGAMASGYTIVTADSFDAAIPLAQTCPILKSGGQISIYEAFEIMQG
jgi:hypothetical protein